MGLIETALGAAFDLGRSGTFWAIASPLLLLAAAAYYWVLPYFTTYADLRCVPGPFLARFSNLWIAEAAHRGQKFAAVDAAHARYGPVVRVGYNHVSIVSPEALRLIYAHGNGFLKDYFYEAFVSGVPGVFNVRDRPAHARKRRIVAHAFSPGAVQDFEPHMSANLVRWVEQLDAISATQAREDKYARLNMMPWCTYLAFDIIGDLAFGAPFGMVQRGRDLCEARVSPQEARLAQATGEALREDGLDPDVILVPGAETLNRRGEVSTTLGLLPAWVRPYMGLLPDPFFRKGLRSVKYLHGMAVAAVDKRLGPNTGSVRLPASEKGSATTSRHDILGMLCNAKDDDGKAISRTELVSEALTQLIAGSDTVSNTACAVVFWILQGHAAHPERRILPRLQAELDAAMDAGQTSIPSYAQVRNLVFLRQCIDEGMRLHSTSALGLPRIVTSAEGVTYSDTVDAAGFSYVPGTQNAASASTSRHFYFPRGTVMSVPSYSLHHDASIWGPDVNEFNPDRWDSRSPYGGVVGPRQRAAFNPFSYGPRACVGQNVAHMELALILGTLFWRYQLRLEPDQQTYESSEGFSKKPVQCFVGIRRRQPGELAEKTV